MATKRTIRIGTTTIAPDAENAAVGDLRDDAHEGLVLVVLDLRKSVENTKALKIRDTEQVKECRDTGYRARKVANISRKCGPQ